MVDLKVSIYPLSQIKKQRQRRNRLGPPILMLFSIIYTAFTSCTSTKKIQYFQDISDSLVMHLPPIDLEQRIIQKQDRLLISFGAQDPEAATVFNRYGGVSTSGLDQSGTSANTGSDIAGFFVDQDGFLEFPLLGKMKAEGLTLQQFREALRKSSSFYLKNPYIIAKFLDFKVTVLGEVASPGTYNLPSTKASLFHALGAAGDLSRTAKRDNIQLFRDHNGVRTVTKIDLRSVKTLNDPQVFLLKNNDVLYVQPRKGGLISENTGFIAGIISVIVSAATLLVTINK
jgi:polysaccharide biosynthesis/export protein